MTTDSVGHRCVGTSSGQPLAELLLCTRGALLRVLELKQLSARHLRHARQIIEEYADFCRSQVEGNPWQLRERFLAAWPEHRALQGRGCGRMLRHHAQVVTRRHLIWLEQQGHLPAGSRAAGSEGLAADTTEDDPQALLEHMVAKVQRQVPELPEGLRQPLLDYLEHLIYQRGLVQSTLESILHTQLALCRQLASAGHDCYARLGAAELDQVVGSLLSAPPEREHLLRRRQQIHAHHSRLRGLLRYLRGRGLLQQDLSRVLISPPCYQASKPSTVLSQQQVHSLLQAVDRGQAGGRRAYAILMLMTTYGLRPIDVSRLRLDDLHWRRGQVALVQKKTGRALTLPLLPEVLRRCRTTCERTVSPDCSTAGSSSRSIGRIGRYVPNGSLGSSPKRCARPGWAGLVRSICAPRWRPIFCVREKRTAPFSSSWDTAAPRRRSATPSQTWSCCAKC